MSAVQALPSLHALSCWQHPETVECPHTWLVVLQVSVVHGLVSLQSLADRQQPATLACPHTPVAALQLSVVQALPSLQSAAVLQQAATAEWLHAPALHASVVHTSESSHWAAEVQAGVALVNSYAPMSGVALRALGLKHAATPPMLVM